MKIIALFFSLLFSVSTSAQTAELIDSGRGGGYIKLDAPYPLIQELREGMPIMGQAKQLWIVKGNETSLRSVLERWSESTDYKLMWEVPVDFSAVAGYEFNGTFVEALQQVVMAINSASGNLRICEYSNRAIRIISRSRKCQES